MHKTSVALVLVLSIGVLSGQEGSWKGEGVYTLPSIPLGAFLWQDAGINADSDHSILLGGVGSDLWHGPEDGPVPFRCLSSPRSF